MPYTYPYPFHTLIRYPLLAPLAERVGDQGGPLAALIPSLRLPVAPPLYNEGRGHGWPVAPPLTNEGRGHGWPVGPAFSNEGRGHGRGGLRVLPVGPQGCQWARPSLTRGAGTWRQGEGRGREGPGVKI